MKKTLTLIAAVALSATMASAATIATVNGKKITTEDVYGELMEGSNGEFARLTPDKQEQIAKRHIDGMITQELIYGDAKKTGVLESAAFKEELEKAIERIKKPLAIKVWEEQQLSSITVSTEEMKKYYDDHKNELFSNEEYQASHILLKPDQKDKAEGLINQLRPLKGDALKAKFIELAKSESVGPSAAKGGDLGYFQKGQMVPEFYDATAKLAVGTITDKPVQSQFGYHIIYLENKRPVTMPTFDEVKPMIEERLKFEKFRSHMDKKMKQLQESATITFGEQPAK